LDFTYFGNSKEQEMFALERNQGVFRKLAKSPHIVPTEIQNNINLQITTKSIRNSINNSKKEKSNLVEWNPENQKFRKAFTEDGYKFEDKITHAVI